MKIYADIVEDYLAGKSLSERQREWFFRQPEYSFTEPDGSEEQKEKVRAAYEQTLKTAQEFIPCNREIWDAVFPNWKELLEHVTVALIIGYPDPMDATVMKSPAGEYTAILDMGLWTKYLSGTPIGELAHNLLTHELCHVCIHEMMPELDEVEETGEYLTKLDAFTFDEGFAHFVSYDGKEAAKVDWNAEKLRQVWLQCSREMREARAERCAEQREEWLYRSICGVYYEKYACMCGMLHLARCWQVGGAAQLAKEFAAGWRGFAEKATLM